MPKHKGPFPIKSTLELNLYAGGEYTPAGCVPSGMVRKFLVVDVPNDMQRGRKGPLLSAVEIDLRLLWRRLQQIGEINRRMRETVMVRRYLMHAN